MNEGRYREELREIAEEYLIHLEQNLKMVELIKHFNIINEEQSHTILDQLRDYRKQLSIIKVSLKKESYLKQIMIEGYSILELLLEIKDYEERLVEILSNKVQFPQGEEIKILLEYCICELDIQLFLNTKFRHKLYSTIFILSEESNFKKA